MKTTAEYEQEIADLNCMNERLKDQLTKALEQVARYHAEKSLTKRGEFHHRAFEHLCPAPALSQITIFK
jgi:hypothetical protein